VEALILAILDGHHALYKAGRHLDKRGMLPLLQPGLEPQSLHDTRLGQSLDALFDANLNQVFSAIALRTLGTYHVQAPWIHQDTTTIGLYGTYEAGRADTQGPRPAYGYGKDGRGDLKQVLLSLGVSGDGGLPFRMGLYDGNGSDTVNVSRAIQQSLALNLEGLQGLVADSKAYTQRTLGLCLETGMGLVTLVPRTCGIRQEVEAWGQRQGSLPLSFERPAKRQGDAPGRWYKRSAIREVEVEDGEGHVALHPSGLSRCIRPSWPSIMSKPMTRLRHERPSHLPRIAPTSKAARLSVKPMPRALWPSMQGVGQAGVGEP
jgi:hypothetical protein